MSNAAGIVFSNLNDNTLSRLTVDRTVAAIPFGCRYRLVDFALSNLVNADIFNICVVANYNYRSLMEHVGSGKDWDLARRVGGIKMISPYQTARTPNMQFYSHHMDALKNMMEFIREIKEENVVLCDTDHICNIDLEAVLREHDERSADLTIVTAPYDPAFTSKNNVMMVASREDGHIVDIVKSSMAVEGRERSVGIYVFRTQYLVAALENAIISNLKSLSEEIMMAKPETKRFYTYTHQGYVAGVSSFSDYYRCSIDLATDPSIRGELLAVENRPIYTKVHNSQPTVYRSGASVRNSMIADGCVIEGTVENSIVFRNVHVAPGAVVRNSILFGNTIIGRGAQINCVVADKSVEISAGSILSGAPSMPFFIDKGRKV